MALWAALHIAFSLPSNSNLKKTELLKYDDGASKKPPKNPFFFVSNVIKCNYVFRLLGACRYVRVKNAAVTGMQPYENAILIKQKPQSYKERLRAILIHFIS